MQHAHSLVHIPLHTCIHHTHSPHMHHTHPTRTTLTPHTQARVEHLLMQNKELLSHLQKLMVQLQQLQTLRLPAQASSTSPPPPPPATSTTPPTTVTSPPLHMSTNPTPDRPIENTLLLDVASHPQSESPLLLSAHTTASPVPPEATPVTSSDELRDTPSALTPQSASPGNEEMAGTVDLVGPATNDPFTPIQLPVASS